ncbi:IscS subfamily cysteine desulfurase [uncultured Paenalcaligenes sp.]|uniref:IscS subfamily cysteine desulfurase n=1 Tax=uncultured Paenalcaligenes sp. TaxID=1588925 RepID=UPI0026292311|nr:IscS subfamily cysteine desulfurase [uncultured Paenalcaligenes sp.]
MPTSYPVYLDCAATTPIDPRVLEQMMPWLTTHFGNPASNTHAYGWDAEEAVEKARAQVAAVIGAHPKEIVWTSGATESNNLAIKGAALAYADKGKHLITVNTEHKAVLDTFAYLQTQGFEVTYLPVNAEGLISIEQLRAALRPDTTLVSVMAVNNEIGVVQDLAGIAALCVEHDVLFHVDAAQAVAKVDLHIDRIPVDLMSFSGHKVYAPKGIGALYVRRKPRVRLAAQIHGGGHERGYRSGTLATHQIVGMGAAFALAQSEQLTETARVTQLQQRLWAGLTEALPALYLNGSAEHRVPYNLNISFAGIEGEALMMSLQRLAVSSGSACSSASLEPSYVLTAIGREPQLAHSALRISLGRQTTEADIDVALDEIITQVRRLRELSPVWDSQTNTLIA